MTQNQEQYCEFPGCEGKFAGVVFCDRNGDHYFCNEHFSIEAQRWLDSSWIKDYNKKYKQTN